MNNRAILLLDHPVGQEPVFGVVIGLVSKTKDDPDNLCRVLVDFPTLEVGSAWARVASFVAGPGRGAFFLPAENDEVLVAFEQGDTSRPYIIGALWNGVDKPPVETDKIQTVREIRTASGSCVQFDDTDQAGTSITVSDSSAGNSVVIDIKNNTITIKAAQNINLQAGSGGKLAISAGSIEITTTEGALSVKSAKSASVTASGPMTIKGSTINLN
jgi:uncharacterized protein involved in type VI secretion and phage assembly